MSRSLKSMDHHTNSAVIGAEISTEPARVVSTGNLDLSDTERLLVKGIFARLREIQREILDPYNADAAQVNAIIEARLGLLPGAIGTTHQVNPQTMRLEAVAG